jgi:hypothetical protein
LQELLGLSCSDITSPFGVSLNLLRAGVNPTAVKSNVSAVDLASLIDYELADKSWSILLQLLQLTKEMQSLIFNFWSTVEHSVPAYEVTAITARTASEMIFGKKQDSALEVPRTEVQNMEDDTVTANNIAGRGMDSVEKTTDLILHLLGSSTLSSGRNAEVLPTDACVQNSELTAGNGEQDIQQEKLHSHRARHLHQLSSTLSSGLVTSYSKMKNLQTLLLSSTGVLDETLKGVHRISVELEDIIARARFVAAISSNVSPQYCSWVKRTVGFSKYDKSVGSFKSWAVLINNAVFFLQQPYSTNVSRELWDINSLLADSVVLSRWIWQ